MSKGIKKMVAVMLAIGAFSVIEPVKYINILNAKAYASSNDVYLKSISLSKGDINFSKSKESYTVRVSKSTEEIGITAKPNCTSDEYDNYTVKINGEKVDKNDDFESTVQLDKGKNSIDIVVKDNDDNERTYTLNIYRRSSSSTEDDDDYDYEDDEDYDDNNDAEEYMSSVKCNQWVETDGKFQYRDGLGIILKNRWFFDPSDGKSYYLDKDGFRTIGWFKDRGYYYYLGVDGAKQTGWKVIEGKWYYLDLSGAMRTGWFKDTDNKTYYLNNDGTIYKGWLKDKDGDWYYLDQSGVMVKDRTVGAYKLGKDGIMIK